MSFWFVELIPFYLAVSSYSVLCRKKKTYFGSCITMTFIYAAITAMIPKNNYNPVDDNSE